MTLGEGGRYDKEANELLINNNAALAAVIVIKGDPKESGFSVASRGPGYLRVLRTALVMVLNQVDQDLASLQNRSEKP